ncbi:MAG: UDP-N-acetylglucosamine--N-acetylmuramyl-(pentapeptide) pyrophosphoryl-undecaprenol N-acetylglucosamine transferase [Cellulomonas sp.]|nr:UDP-N-acetylglucosamine--N-acetylmuramyl-(pentapeptide) pyrophosphoryl-undecaprenol N-acetylglucosamine transferase [Cellulomonas sp.]
MAEPLRVLLAGGGTAGHVNPLLALAAELRARHDDAQIVVLGTAEGLEARLVPAAGFELAVVPRVPLPRRPSLDLFRLPGRLRRAVAAAGRAIDDVGTPARGAAGTPASGAAGTPARGAAGSPARGAAGIPAGGAAGAQVVVGFGGYVATPAYLAARRRSVPVVVHEQNARPGLANRLGARRAVEVAVTFPGTPLPRATVTGLPLRPALAGLLADLDTDREGTRRQAAQALGLSPDTVTLLVTGGSLGALSVNQKVVGAAREILDTGAQVLHLTGKGKAEAVRQALDSTVGLSVSGDLAARWQVREYLDDMHLALAVADLVVCRAGAGTVCEMAALGIPAVYVPLPVGNGEQRRNARDVVGAGGGLLVDDKDLSAAWVRERVPPLLRADGADRRAQMGAAAAAVGVRDGAARLADLVEAHAARPSSTP